MQAEIGPQLRIDYRLYAAARNGNVDGLNVLLTPPPHDGIAIDIGGEVMGPVSLSAINFNRETALHIAASFGHIELVTKICDQNSNLMIAVNNKSETPLHYAAGTGKGEVVKHFIQFAKELHQYQNTFHSDDGMELLRWRNQDGETALYQAVRNKHIAVVKMLIKADPHLASIPDNNNASPLYLAATENSPDIVGILIESLKGDHVPREAYAGPQGQTALHAAVLRINRGISQSISKWKPELATSVDDAGSTPLHYAAARRGTDIWVLLEMNETNRLAACISDSSGQFPVHVAATMGNLAAVIQLFDSEICPNPDKLLDARGRNFLHIAVEKRKVNVVWWACNESRVVRAMNARDNEGNTPLHLAVKAKDVQIFAHLIASKKVYVGVMSKKGLTPLDVARAQFKIQLHDWRNSELIILRTLLTIGAFDGISRTDLFVQEFDLEWNEEKMMKDSERYENIAKNLSIGSVLIASASFAGAFTVFNAYKADVNLSCLPGLSLAFKAFVLMVVYAFICSITATALLIRAALTYLDPKYRESNIGISIRLVMMAIRGFISAFAIGAYVILTPVSKGLAILVCVTGIVLPAFTDPHTWPNILVARALLKFIGWRELRRIQRFRSTRDPTAPTPIRDSILWEWRLFIWDIFLYSFIVLLVLVGSLINFIILRHIVLALVGVLLLLALVDTVTLFAGCISIRNYVDHSIYFPINFIIDFIVSCMFILIERGMLLLERIRARHSS